MFEKIVLRRSHAGPALTLGEVAEALLFYQNVHIILDGGALRGFVSGSFGMRGLLNLLSRPNVTAVYTEDMLGTRTNTVGNHRIHDFIAFTWQGDKETGAINSKQGRLEHLLYKAGNSRKESRQLAERFLRKVPVRGLASDHFVSGGIPKAAVADLLNHGYAEQAVRRIVQGTPGLEDYAESARASVVLVRGGGFELLTNIDFAAASARRQLLVPKLEPITDAHLTSALLDVTGDTVLAAHYGGEFYTSDVTSDLVRLRHADLMKRAGISARELQELKDVVLDDYPTICEVINSGARTFDEFLNLLDKSQKFRQWIQGLSPDAKVTHEYVREISAEGWMASLPAKAVRYVLATTAGLAGVIPGAVAGAVDSFVLDRISKGWRPSHFVDGRLRPFLKSNEQ